MLWGSIFDCVAADEDFGGIFFQIGTSILSSTSPLGVCFRVVFTIRPSARPSSPSTSRRTPLVFLLFNGHFGGVEGSMTMSMWKSEKNISLARMYYRSLFIVFSQNSLNTR